MRSRYSAFALGLGDYLVDTLSDEHPDREIPRAAMVKSLSHAKDSQRFMGLRIVEASESGDSGQVLFVATIYEKGVDHSFAERSAFERKDGAWKYAGGDLVPRSRLPSDLAALTREAFEKALGLR